MFAGKEVMTCDKDNAKEYLSELQKGPLLINSFINLLSPILYTKDAT